jgi:hypothetical protein
VADPKKQAAKLGAEAMIDAGKDAARKLYEDLTLSDEEKEKREAEREAAAKRKRWKWIAYGVGGLLVVLSLMMLLAKIWPWILGMALVAGLAYMGYRYLRGKLGGGDAEEGEKAEGDEKKTKKKRSAKDDEDAAEEEPAAAKRVAPAPRVRIEERPEDVAARRAAEAAKAEARERQIDDELAELKRKAGKS